MTGRAWVELDVEAVRANVRTIRRVAGAEVLAVVKANGYGHGAVDVARAALEAGAVGLCVATADEVVALRAAGLAAPLQLLGAALDDELEAAAAARASLTLTEPEGLGRLRALARRLGRRLDVHVKVDVGMHRVGVPPEAAPALARAIARDPDLRLAGLMTHLQAPRDVERSRAQVGAFAAVARRLARAGVRPPQVHAAASAALFKVPEARFSHVRPGIALLGLDPEGAIAATGAALAPALALRARVVSTSQVAAGEAVGYGARWTAARPTRLALLGLGYADGLPHGLTGKPAHALLQGRRCPLVATVMMDGVLVDVTDLERPPVRGDVATLFGRDGAAALPLEEVAAQAGLIPYAVSCGLGARLGRVVFDRAAAARAA